MLHQRKQILEFAISNASYIAEHSPEKITLENSCDLHDEIFNQQYFIIGRYNSTKFLGSHTFEFVDLIQEYLEDNYGSDYKFDFSDPEKIVNMGAYIIGLEIIEEVIAGQIGAMKIKEELSA